MNEKLIIELEGLHWDVFCDVAFHYRMAWIWIAGAVLQVGLWVSFICTGTTTTSSTIFELCFSVFNLSMAWWETVKVAKRRVILDHIEQLKKAANEGLQTQWDHHLEQVQAAIKNL